MADVLGRGWSPTTRQYRFLRFGLAILLVASPALVYVSGYGQPTYRYEAVEIRPSDDGFQYDSRGTWLVDGFEGVSCDGWRRSRLCLLEGELVDENRTYDDPPGAYDPPEERYTYHDGQFYERVHEGRYGPVVIGLRPVSPREVLEGIAGDFERLERPLQRAVEGDTGTVHRDIDATGRVVRYEGSYYVLYLSGQAEARGYAQSVFAVLVGLGLLSRAVRDELDE